MRVLAKSFALSLVLFATAGIAQDLKNQCLVKPFRSDALDFPSKHAWNLFIWLNHPAVDKNRRRGVADCTKPIGAPGSTSVWETWRNAATEVFLPTEPPNWDDTSLPDEKPGSTPSGKTLAALPAPTSTSQTANSPEPSFHRMRGSSGIKPKFSPEDGVFDDSGGFGETRINKATFEFIRDECLYNRQATERYARAILDKKKPPISLPPESIEVKAAWLDFEKEKIPLDRQKAYYAAEYKGKKYGLVALHVLTKDIPNWFWASFHHIDSPANKWEGKDLFGRPKLLNGTVWENYVLGGTQTDFVTANGKPTILSDHYVEFGFQKSSCITCHATATIAATSAPRRIGMPAGQSRSVCLLDPNQPPFSEPALCKRFAGEHLYKPSGELIEERGSPLPEWYVVNNVDTYLQTDFLYSIPFRAGQVEEQGPPPSRCVW